MRCIPTDAWDQLLHALGQLAVASWPRASDRSRSRQGILRMIRHRPSWGDPPWGDALWLDAAGRSSRGFALLSSKFVALACCPPHHWFIESATSTVGHRAARTRVFVSNHAQRKVGLIK